MTIQQIFEHINTKLGATRTGQGNNDLHETKHYSIFVATFGGPYVAVCNKSCTTMLFAIENEMQMLQFLKRAEK